eukprot:10541165-Prorocentrum_lima.AAC.1
MPPARLERLVRTVATSVGSGDGLPRAEMNEKTPIHSEMAWARILAATQRPDSLSVEGARLTEH